MQKGTWTPTVDGRDPPPVYLNVVMVNSDVDDTPLAQAQNEGASDLHPDSQPSAPPLPSSEEAIGNPPRRHSKKAPLPSKKDPVVEAASIVTPFGKDGKSRVRVRLYMLPYYAIRFLILLSDFRLCYEIIIPYYQHVRYEIISSDYSLCYQIVDYVIRLSYYFFQVLHAARTLCCRRVIISYLLIQKGPFICALKHLYS